MCLERSELGNLLFGLSSQVAGIVNSETFFGGYVVAEGLQEPWDQAAAGVGYYVGESGLRISDVDTMCQIFRSSTGVWNLPLLPAKWPGTTPWNWSLIQDERIQGCVICEKAIPSSTPHTIPAYAGEAAGSSPFAGAPRYIYYTEQIPEGMLDPRLSISSDVYMSTILK
jgi:hypothetical protein